MFANSTKYAIRAVLFLSRNRKQNNKLKVIKIAEELSIPKAFLSKILQQLSRNNLVSSSKGRGGGFYLSSENAKMTLLDIVICIEGENVLDNCILGLPNCGDENPCHLHKYYKNFKTELNKVVTDITIEELFEDDSLQQYKL